MSLNPLWRALRRVIKPSLAELQDWIKQLPPQVLEQLLLWLAGEIAARSVNSEQ
jgi:hypothetical protein